MAAGPGGMVPSGYGHMRSSQADRERAVDVLKAAFAEGRLDSEEYSERVGQVYASRTYADLAALTADLPTGPFGTLTPQAPSLPERLPQPQLPVSPRRRRNPPVIPLLVVALLVATAMPSAYGALGIVPLVLIAIFTFSLLRSR